MFGIWVWRFGSGCKLFGVGAVYEVCLASASPKPEA